METKNRRETTQFMLRLLTPLHLRLKEEAAASGRSLNAEMEFRLAQSLGMDYADMQEKTRGTLEVMAADIKALRQIAEAFAKGEMHVHTIAA